MHLMASMSMWNASMYQRMASSNKSYMDGDYRMGTSKSMNWSNDSASERMDRVSVVIRPIGMRTMVLMLTVNGISCQLVSVMSTWRLRVE